MKSKSLSQVGRAMQLRRTAGWLAASILIVALFTLRPDAARAQVDESGDHSGEPVPRLILALYDGRDEGKVRWTRLHRYVELVINHLGFHMVYHDIARGMPADVLDPDYAAVMSWLEGPVPDPQAYAAWAGTVRTQAGTADGLKLIVLGATGLSAAAADSQAQAFLGRIGIDRLVDDHRFGPWGRLAYRDPALIGFERDFTVSDTTLPLVRAVPPAVSHLSLTEPDALGAATTDLVVTAPTGAYVEESALIRYDADAEMSFWVLNPFRFFESLLGNGLRPIPDTTTLDGRRIFFSHIQGDGWTAPLPADRPDEPVRLGGSVILDELIRPFPDLPVSLALITGALDPELGGRFAKMGEDTARAAFSLPSVEVASCTRTLPLRWGFFENYRRDEELQAIERAGAAKASPNRGLLTEAFSSLAEVFADDLSRASAARASGLRKYTRDPFDLDAEIAGSLAGLTALAPPERPATLIAWGGDTQVFEAALARARLTGVAAIGGGGGLYDPVAASITNLTPLSVQVGAERQIYHALGGDALYTNFWTEPIHGLLRLQGVLDATERPRRLKPFELSYSAFSALRFGSLNAIKTLLERARKEFVVPIRASQYARIAEGFTTVQTFSTGPRQWRIERRGALQTIRFDTDAGDLELDTARCRGVLGGRHEEGAFYVSLDPAEEGPIVALEEPRPRGEGGPGEADAVFALDNTRWMIRGLATDDCKAVFDASGFGQGEMTWRVPHAGSYHVEMYEGATATSSSGPVFWEDAIAKDDGRLSLSLPDVKGRPVRVAISSCPSGS